MVWGGGIIGYLDFIMILHGVLTQEIELNHIVIVACNMLDSQRAATDCVGFIFAFFVTHTQSLQSVS